MNLSFPKKILIVRYYPGLVLRETKQMGCAEESVRAKEKLFNADNLYCSAIKFPSHFSSSVPGETFQIHLSKERTKRPGTTP